MALATNPIDINRGTNGITLPADIASEILAKTQHESAVMRLATPITLPGRGLAIPVVLGDPVAQIVGETAEKPVSNATFATKTMQPKKFAVIELFSNEFKRDLPALYDALVDRLPGSIAKAFDNQVFNGTALAGFDSLAAAPAVQRGATDTIADVVTAGMMTVAGNGFRVDGFAASPLYETELITATDNNGRPLFMNDFANDDYVGRVFGQPVAETDAITTMYGGDWGMAKYGIVDGINIKISEEATINDGTNQINLFQRNMFAVLIEAELGFVCADDDAFFRVTV